MQESRPVWEDTSGDVILGRMQMEGVGRWEKEEDRKGGGRVA